MAGDGGVKVYDEDRDTRAVGVGVNHKPYHKPDSTSAVKPAPRDWGTAWRFLPWLSYEPDIGLFFGAGFSRYGYGFRKDPYATWWRLRAGYATSASAPRADLLGEFRRENSPVFFQLYARASGIEVVRFFGFGNETPLVNDDLSRVEQQQYQFNLALGVPVSRQLTFSLGPIVWTLISEIYPNRVRGRAIAVATAANWLAAFLVAQFFLSLVDAIGESTTFFLFSALCIVTYVFVLRLVPETKGRSLEEIQERWVVGGDRMLEEQA